MSLVADLKSLEPHQRSAIWASYLGWTLDAFDFFLLVFMLKAISIEFGTDVKAVAVAIFVTLAARPFGALGLPDHGQPGVHGVEGGDAAVATRQLGRHQVAQFAHASEFTRPA